jgi:glycerol-3-phosphate dehydrogenase
MNRPATTNPALNRLYARYGEAADHIVGIAQEGELAPVGTTDILWAELRWAARCEQVVHLEDLLLRRTRLGILCKRGGAEHLPAIRGIAMAELGWDADRWQAEVTSYFSLIANHYSLPSRETIPGWDKKPTLG